MGLVGQGEDQRRPLMGPSVSVSAVFEGSEEIAAARAMARNLLMS
ncbi:hypothetical protein OK006_11093, partial [Actinobacteria bacterium OK006]